MELKKILNPTEITTQTQDGKIEIVCSDREGTTLITVSKNDIDSLIKGLQSCKRVLEEV